MATHVVCCGLLFYLKCYQNENHLHLLLAIVPSHLTFSMIHNLLFANIANTTIFVLNGCDICNILPIALSNALFKIVSNEYETDIDYLRKLCLCSVFY